MVIFLFLFVKRKQFSKSDTKQFLAVHPELNDFITKKSLLVQEDDYLYIDNVRAFFQVDSKWVPTLHLLLQHPTILPSVTVDKGAIKFVVNGADIMRPGITAAQDFAEGDFVVIIDENYGKPLCVGRALFSSSQLLEKNSGKVVVSLHFVGDDIWNNS